MADKLVMLALSPTMEEGKIVNWNINEGDSFSEGDVLCEVETDKASMEYESIEEGTLLKIIVPAGGSVKVGAPIAIYGEEGEDISDLLKSVREGGGAEEADKEQQQPAGQKEEKKVPEESVVLNRESDDSGGDRADGSRVKISPLARRIAENNDISVSSIKGSGPGGRIIRDDVEKALAQPGTGSKIQGTAGRVRLSDEEIEVSQKRKIIARRLSESKFSAPHYYLTVEVTVDGLIEARNNLNRGLKSRKISFNSFFIKLVAEAVKKHPEINSTWKESTIVRHGSVDVGIAVALEDGLITPVVRNCAGKGIVNIDDDLVSLIEKARGGKLAPEEYSGATFTISNLGSFGIDQFTAIINPPASAILAIGQAKKKPLVIDDEIVIRTCLTMTLSCDHRVIDGAVGAAFLNELKLMFQEPVRALY